MNNNFLKGIVITLSCLTVISIISVCCIISFYSGNNSDSTTYVNSTNNKTNLINNNEKIIGEYNLLESNSFYTITGLNSKEAEEYSRINQKKAANILKNLDNLKLGNVSLYELREEYEEIEPKPKTYYTTMIFNRDGSYIYTNPQSVSGIIKVKEEIGTYELINNELTLYPNTDSKRTYNIEFNNEQLEVKNYYNDGSSAFWK